jgi:hypothetical protein
MPDFANLTEWEQEEFDSAVQRIALMFLSNSRIDQKYASEKIQPFLENEAGLTAEEIESFRSSRAYETCVYLAGVWKASQSGNKYNLGDWLSIAERAALALQIPYRTYATLVSKDERVIASVDFLSQAVLLPGASYGWSEKKINLNLVNFTDVLGQYLQSGIRWKHLERVALQQITRHSYDREKAKKTPIAQKLSRRIFQEDTPKQIALRLILQAVGRLAGVSTRIFLSFAPLVWAINDQSINGVRALNLVAFAWPSWVLFDWFFSQIAKRQVAASTAISAPIEQFGLTKDETMSKNLMELERLTNMFAYPVHINLRAVRYHLRKEIARNREIPIELLSILDRAIAADEHFW